jgi:predicted nucleotidyltransferase
LLSRTIHAACTLKLPSIGGSDCHIIEQVGKAVTEFFNPIQTIDDMIREIKKGNCQSNALHTQQPLREPKSAGEDGGCEVCSTFRGMVRQGSEGMKKRMNLEEIKRILEEVKGISRKEYKAEIMGIFGSYVRGKEKEMSDIDILVRFLEGATLLDFVGLADFLEEKLHISVDIVPIDTIRKELEEHILKEEAVYL